MARAGAWLAYGDRDKAFDYLDRAYKEHDGVVYTVPFDPAWAAARIPQIPHSLWMWERRLYPAATGQPHPSRG